MILNRLFVCPFWSGSRTAGRTSTLTLLEWTRFDGATMMQATLQALADGLPLTLWGHNFLV
jgi:hypothetical protein